VGAGMQTPALHVSDQQSRSTRHDCPTAQLLQVSPPQSTSVSVPFLIPSVHVGGPADCMPPPPPPVPPIAPTPPVAPLAPTPAPLPPTLPASDSDEPPSPEPTSLEPPEPPSPDLATSAPAGSAHAGVRAIEQTTANSATDRTGRAIMDSTFAAA